MATINSSTPGVVRTSGMRNAAVTAKLKAGIVAAKVVKYGKRFLDNRVSHPGATNGGRLWRKPETVEGKTRRDTQAAAMPSATNRVTQP